MKSLAVFGALEKEINNKDTLEINSPYHATISNVNIGFSTESSMSSSSSNNCTAIVYMYIEWQLDVYSIGNTVVAYSWYINASIDVVITCNGDGPGGGNGGTGNGDNNNPWDDYPNDDNNPWHDGLGWPTDVLTGFDPNTWYPWWMSGSGSIVTTQNKLTYLSSIYALGINSTQRNWLMAHTDRLDELYNYILTSTDADKKVKAKEHLFRMMNDADYLAFVKQHSITGNPLKMWWEDVSWLSPFGNSGYGNWAINYLINHQNVTFSIFENQFMTIPEGKDDSFDDVYWNNPGNNFPHQNLPSLFAFSNAFPSRADNQYSTPYKLYSSIGGDVFTNGYTRGDKSNTCAARLSKALNYSGVTIPFIPGQTFLGNDGKYYFLGAENLNKWMRKTFGCANPNTNIGEYYNPDCIHKDRSQIDPYGENLPLDLYGSNGIYSMVSYNVNWATGHADIIGSAFGAVTCDGGCDFNGPIDYINIWLLH